MWSKYKYLQLLSIDVVIGACMMAYSVSLLLHVNLPWSIYFCLGGAVWLVYTIDHLLDAKEIDQKVITPRHSFHQQYFSILVKSWVAVFCIVLAVTIFWLPVITIKFGLIASALVIIHLVLVKLLGTKLSLIVQKEFGVAVAYMVGVVVGPLSLAMDIPAEFYLYAIQIFLLAFINLLEFSFFDKRVDQLQGQVSLSLVLGRGRLSAFIWLLIVMSLGLNGYMLIHFGWSGLQLVVFCAWLVLSLIMVFPKVFIKDDYYRVFGDMVFLFPIALL